MVPHHPFAISDNMTSHVSQGRGDEDLLDAMPFAAIGRCEITKPATRYMTPLRRQLDVCDESEAGKRAGGNDEPPNEPDHHVNRTLTEVRPAHLR